MASPDRRQFFATSAGAGALSFLGGLPVVSAADAKPDPNLVRLDSGIEPLVRLIEDTPREKLLEEVGSRVKKGLAYRDALAALLLAGVRNIQPRPSVGFKFHAVLVVNSAHQAALAGPDNERWLPLFWALDNFKGAQATNAKESAGWRMKPVEESKLPVAAKAVAAFTAAMDDWDVEAADLATAAVARSATPGELFELYARYGSRDFRDIGHKAIFVANAFRTLEVIGWHHAEPVLRSLSYALLHHEGTNPAKREGEPDAPGRRNKELVGKIKRFDESNAATKASHEVITQARTATDAELCDQSVALLNGGSGARAVWDGLFLAGTELLMRQPGIVALHSLTSLNALHYAARTTANAETRKFLLLQASAFVPLFRDAMKARGKVGEAKIDALTVREEDKEFTVRDAFAELSRNKETAARTALTVLKSDPTAAKELTDEARRLIFLKGTDSHDYKFSSAVLEDAAFLNPALRDRFLAASLFWLKGSGSADAPLVKRTHAALS